VGFSSRVPPDLRHQTAQRRRQQICTNITKPIYIELHDYNML
jgi:hypothetical protein